MKSSLLKILIIGLIIVLAILVYNLTRPKTSFDACYKSCREMLKGAPRVEEDGVELSPEAADFMCVKQCK